MKRILLVVDPQNDFAHPKGALSVFGGKKVVLAIDYFIYTNGAQYDYMFLSRDWHPKNHCSFQINGGIWPAHCVANTWGAGSMLSSWTMREIRQKGLYLYKGTDSKIEEYSAMKARAGLENDSKFFGSTVHEFITDKEIDPFEVQIDIVGIALDYCVKETAIEAAQLGFKVRVLTPLTAAVNRQGGDVAKAVMAMVEAGVEIISKI